MTGSRTGEFVGLQTAERNAACARSRLQVDVRKCRKCGACERACPSGAMGLRGGEYVIDVSRCHHCYCCSELCPAGAVRAQGVLGALLRRSV